MVEPPTEGYECILTMRVDTIYTHIPIPIIIYAQTPMATHNAKYEYYENLCATIL